MMLGDHKGHKHYRSNPLCPPRRTKAVAVGSAVALFFLSACAYIYLRDRRVVSWSLRPTYANFVNSPFVVNQNNAEQPGTTRGKNNGG